MKPNKNPSIIFSSGTIYFWELAKGVLGVCVCLGHKVRLKRGLREGRLLVAFAFRLESDLLAGQASETELYPCPPQTNCVVQLEEKLVTLQPWFSDLRKKGGLESLRFF